jgi:DnaJ-class molecular chaperone
MCRGRNFVAQCLGCNGKGQTEEKMAGGPGQMLSTCNICGGTGTLPATKAQYEAQEAKKEEVKA